jgi:hypothetical protein
VAVVQVVLSDSLSADQARAMGLDARDYAAGEQITVEQRYADGLTRAGYTAPVGDAATVVYGGMDPSIPAFIRQTGGTYPTRASVTNWTRPARGVDRRDSAHRRRRRTRSRESMSGFRGSP